MSWLFRRDLWIIIILCILWLFFPLTADSKIGPLKFPLDYFLKIQRCDQTMYGIWVHDLKVSWARYYQYAEEEWEEFENGSLVYIINDTQGCD